MARAAALEQRAELREDFALQRRRLHSAIAKIANKAVDLHRSASSGRNAETDALHDSKTKKRRAI